MPLSKPYNCEITLTSLIDNQNEFTVKTVPEVFEEMPSSKYQVNAEDDTKQSDYHTQKGSWFRIQNFFKTQLLDSDTREAIKFPSSGLYKFTFELSFEQLSIFKLSCTLDFDHAPLPQNARLHVDRSLFLSTFFYFHKWTSLALKPATDMLFLRIQYNVPTCIRLFLPGISPAQIQPQLQINAAAKTKAPLYLSFSAFRANGSAVSEDSDTVPIFYRKSAKLESDPSELQVITGFRQGSDFNLVTKLGFGTFSTVYLATFQKCEYAFKIFRSENSEAVRKEASILNRLKHPNIIKCVAIAMDSRMEHSIADILVLEYCSKGTLYNTLHPNEEAARRTRSSNSSHLNSTMITDNRYQWISQIISALAHIHSCNIIHADLSSMNILLTHDNMAKVADFGLSRVGQSFPSSQFGCNRWRAPELFSKERNQPEFTNKIDIWSFGIICWELLHVGNLPFSNVVDEDLAWHIPRHGLRIDAKLQKSYKALLILCLQNDPSQRRDASLIREYVLRDNFFQSHKMNI